MTDEHKSAVEKAEQAWKDYFAKRFFLSTAEEKITSYALLKSYQSSLRREIESCIEQVDNDSSLSNAYKEAKINGLKKSLELLNTVTPNTETK